MKKPPKIYSRRFYLCNYEGLSALKKHFIPTAILKFVSTIFYRRPYPFKIPIQGWQNDSDLPKPH